MYFLKKSIWYGKSLFHELTIFPSTFEVFRQCDMIYDNSNSNCKLICTSKADFMGKFIIKLKCCVIDDVTNRIIQSFATFNLS